MMFRWSLVPLRVAAVGFALAASTLLSGHVQAQESAPSTLKVFHLKNASADDAGQLVVQVLGDSLRMAVDERTNSLIVQGGDESLQQMEQLLMELDSQPAKAAPPSATQLPPVQVRIFWLLSEGANGAPPEGLKPVLEEMKELGIENLRLAGQMSVNVSGAGRPVLIRSRPMIGQEECLLEFEGQVRTGNSGRPLMEARISCKAGDGEGTAEIAALDSTIDAPLNQFIVLGTTTAGGANSVFVMQLVPKDKQEPKTIERDPGR